MELQTPTSAQRIEGIATYRCGACHGAQGQGKNPMFPKLAGQNPEYLVKQITNFKTGVRKGQIMLYQLGDLSSDDIQALAFHFSRIPLLAGEVKDNARRDEGKKLYLTGNSASGNVPCAQCHGPTARGAGMMPRLAGQHVEYISEQIYRFIDFERVSGQTQRHPTVLNLNYDEIRAISLYLSALE